MSEEYGRRLASLGLDPARTAGITPAQVASMLGLHSTDSIDEVLSEMERASPGEVTAASVRAGKTLDVLVAWHLGSVLRKEVDVLPPELAEAVRRKLDAETQGVEEMARRLNGELQRARALGAEARADLLTLQEKLAKLDRSDPMEAAERFARTVDAVSRECSQFLAAWPQHADAFAEKAPVRPHPEISKVVASVAKKQAVFRQAASLAHEAKAAEDEYLSQLPAKAAAIHAKLATM